MIGKRHHEVASQIVESVTRKTPAPSLASAVDAASKLRELHRFNPPCLSQLVAGLRPPLRQPEDAEPGCRKEGWQHEAALQIERHREERILPQLTDHERAQLRSEWARSGFGARSGPFLRHDSHSVAPVPRDPPPPALFVQFLAPAGVAVSPTSVAIIAQDLECWDGEVSRWRVLQNESAEREARGAQRDESEVTEVPEGPYPSLSCDHVADPSVPG